MTHTAPGKNKHFIQLITALAAVFIVMAGLLLCYSRFGPRPEGGRKHITVEVVYKDGTSDSYDIETDAEYLEQALGNAKGLTVEGSRTEQFGLMIETVNGVRADYNQDQAYWAVELEGEPCNYGVSQQPIRDGQHYGLVYTAAGPR